MAVQEIIKSSDLPKALVARLAGVNEATVWAWLRPDGPAARSPSPESVHKLADGFREYSTHLAGLADDLEREVEG